MLRLGVRAIEAVSERLAESGHEDVKSAHAKALGLAAAGDASIAEMAQAADMTKQGMCYLVDYLETRGYVALEPHPRDRRAKRVRVTEKGVAVHQESVVAMEHLVEKWRSDVDPEDWAAFERVLRRLADGGEP
jgi:DNA-binding MarR family transcriptional regulator